MRPFVVCLPSGVRYWTVLGDDMAVVVEADAFLRYLRLSRDCSELTTRSYAGGIALFLGWCASTHRHWHAGVADLGLFITWLRHAGSEGLRRDTALGQPMAAVLAQDSGTNDQVQGSPLIGTEARFGSLSRDNVWPLCCRGQSSFAS